MPLLKYVRTANDLQRVQTVMKVRRKDRSKVSANVRVEYVCHPPRSDCPYIQTRSHPALVTCLQYCNGKILAKMQKRRTFSHSILR